MPRVAQPCTLTMSANTASENVSRANSGAIETRRGFVWLDVGLPDYGLLRPGPSGSNRICVAWFLMVVVFDVMNCKPQSYRWGPDANPIPVTKTRSMFYGYAELRGGNYTLTFDDTGTEFGRKKPQSTYDGWFV